MSAPIRLITDWQMPVFLVNSRLGLLYDTTAYLLLNRQWSHFSRSYVRSLPSSLTRVLSSALDCSSRLPVSVYGTVSLSLALEIISWHDDYTRFASLALYSLRNSSPARDLPRTGITCYFDRDNRRPAGLRLMRHLFKTEQGTGI